jgi:arylformamidase
MNRRAFFGTAAAGIAFTKPGRAQTATKPPRPKGPLVWLDMDQKDLDDAYDQNVWAQNRPQLQARFVTNSEAARKRLGVPHRLQYGPTSIEALDAYLTSQVDAPICVYVHGGAWLTGEAKNYAFNAELFVRAGAHFLILDFINVQEAGGNLLMMSDQVNRAVAWVYRNAKSFRGDPNRMYIAGHSSGAHLAAVAMTTDWNRDFGLSADILKGAVCSSGMYDLKPVRLSARSNYIKFTDEMEEKLSPQRHLNMLRVPVVVSYGTYESPEFQRQARDFAKALKDAGKQVELVVGQGYDHLEMNESIGNPYAVVGRAALEQMKLRSCA